MIARLLLAMSIVGICSAVEAQNCHSTVSYSSPCAGSYASYKAASSVCKSNKSVYAGSATSTCQSAGALAANIASQCSSECVAPPPPPPYVPTYFAPRFTGAAVSYEPVLDNSKLVKVTWAYSEKDYLTCAAKRTHKFVAVLDKSNVKNAAYFTANPISNSSKFLSVQMACLTSTTSVKTYDASYNSTTTFANGCFVYSSYSSSDPSYCKVYYYQQIN